jgi:hypothetical protein
MSKIIYKVFCAGLVLLIMAIGLGSCGKKSALTPPTESKYPKKYPRS